MQQSFLPRTLVRTLKLGYHRLNNPSSTRPSRTSGCQLLYLRADHGEPPPARDFATSGLYQRLRCIVTKEAQIQRLKISDYVRRHI